jgi:hypothetical protein
VRTLIPPLSRPIRIAAIAIVVVGLLSGFVLGRGLFAPLAQTNPAPTPSSAAQATAHSSPSPTHMGQQASPAAGEPTPTSAVTPAPTESPVPLVRATVPLVPVVSFWSNMESISREQVLDALAGTWPEFSRVVIPEGTGPAIAAALGLPPAMALGELDLESLRDAVADGALGLLPLPMVTPEVRALALDGVALFGNDRTDSLGAWPLNVTLDLPAFTWEQANTWTLVAGGDIMLDRGTAHQVTVLGKGVDYPWDGGTVSVTGHHCCTPFGWPVPETKRTGNKGIVRELFVDADLAMANLETPVKEEFTYHTGGLIFTGDPELLKGIKNAGFDFMSLANNHIGNGGRRGVVETIDHLSALEIAYAGAGINLEQAAAPAFLDAGGQRVAIVSCAMIGGYVATDERWGALRCGDPATLRVVGEARASADVVIVFPHWGREYESLPNKGQRRLAEAWVAAGVDLVVGAHPHWAGALEEINDRLVFYTLGNLVFDQTWSEATMEGLVLELTFQGSRVVQAWIHPIFIMSEVQPNLLDYDGGGSIVLEKVRDASRRLDW